VNRLSGFAGESFQLMRRCFMKLATKIQHTGVEIGKEDEKLVIQILKSIKGIRYGYVQIVVQDSKVVQIDKTQKFRFDKEDFYR
jgi:hypothetical protein